MLKKGIIQYSGMCMYKAVHELSPKISYSSLQEEEIFVCKD